MLYNLVSAVALAASLFLHAPIEPARAQTITPDIIQETDEARPIMVAFVCLQASPLIELGGILNRYGAAYGDVDALPQYVKRQLRDVLESYRAFGVCQYDPDLRPVNAFMIRRDENPLIVYNAILSDGSRFQVVRMPLWVPDGYPNAPDYIYVTKIGEHIVQ